MGKAGATLSESVGIYKAAQGAQRYAVVMCNRDMTKGEEARQEKLESFLRAAPARLGHGWEIETGRDPRGAVVVLKTPSGRELCL